MSLEFTVIPSKKLYEENAYDVISMMKHNIPHAMNIELDDNYDKSLSARIVKWKKEDYDIIIVDENYQESGHLSVRFCDKDSKPKKLSLMEFIDLVSSFEEQKDEDSTDDDTTCVIS